MPSTIQRQTLLALIVIALLLLVVFPLYPLYTVSFQAGIVVGLMLHTAHVSENVERGERKHNV